jgi:RDD family
VPDKPRILEAPEAVPKQVPLGGIIIESDDDPLPPKLEMPLPVAPIPMRMLAGLTDMALVLCGMLGFLAIAGRVSKLAVPGREFLLLWVALPCCLWILYQHAFLVYTGTTPGLRLARLQLSCFGGTCPSQRLRRSRALAMILSAASLGLGFLWALLDEDTLCWHDRITRTFFTMETEKHPGLLVRMFGPNSKLHRLLQDRIPQPPVS